MGSAYHQDPIAARLHRSSQERPTPLASSETSDQSRQRLLTIQALGLEPPNLHGRFPRSDREYVATDQVRSFRGSQGAGLKPQTLQKLEFRFAKGGHGLQWQNLIVTNAKGQVQIGWRIYMIDGVIMNTGAEVWQKLQDAMWQWRTVTVVFFTDHRAILMEEKIKEEEEERREVERLAKLPFTSTSDEKHLEQLKQEFTFQGYIDRSEDRAITLEQLQRVVDFSKAWACALCILNSWPPEAMNV
ncbi:hypothetical protein AK812_SmicGene33633 [Symbiodinium microadriaticum]|uniref:Uncharacterized protein n=1 Tax=Symbiodinium microadriaticum TaxID=2951 RepID=A0A1Q9CR42_SYMMI|nr:hypothetical protein AK812_SmicGene33633 [Symbiodinium microadriaticum]